MKDNRTLYTKDTKGKRSSNTYLNAFIAMFIGILFGIFEANSPPFNFMQSNTIYDIFMGLFAVFTATLIYTEVMYMTVVFISERQKSHNDNKP